MLNQRTTGQPSARMAASRRRRLVPLLGQRIINLPRISGESCTCYRSGVTPETSRRTAIALGVGLPLLQACRETCFGKGWPPPLEWPIAVDAYVTGALLLVGATAAARSTTRGRLLLAAAWGFTCGLMYRTFFEQLGDPERHAGPQMMVLVIKGIILGVAVLGFVGATRPEVPTR